MVASCLFGGNIILNEFVDLTDEYYVCFSPFCIGLQIVQYS